jgi:hypothetical protein
MTHHNQTKELITWFLNLPLDESISGISLKGCDRVEATKNGVKLVLSISLTEQTKY